MVVLILADDLTGAADCAAAFAASGHAARVVLAAGTDTTNVEDDNSNRAVVSVDVNSRAMPLESAVAATAAAMQPYLAQLESGPDLFVKIDSTGRGHVRATVEAVLAALPSRPAGVVVCPAFPALGRTVVDGWIHVDGEPLGSGNLREAFTGFPVASRLVIPAVRTDEQLAALVRSMTGDVLWVGSAGLARHIAARLPAVAHPAQVREPSSRVVVVAGSQHDRSLEQLARLKTSALGGTTRVFRVDPRDKSFLDQARPTIAAADGLVLTGGRTARAVLDLLDVSQFDVVGEVEIGMPWGIAHFESRRVTLVTKAGGFGDEGSLLRGVQFLTQPY